MKLFFVLALVVMSFGGLNAAVIPEEMVRGHEGSILSIAKLSNIMRYPRFIYHDFSFYESGVADSQWRHPV